jgi:hypothetical protein
LREGRRSLGGLFSAKAPKGESPMASIDTPKGESLMDKTTPTDPTTELRKRLAEQRAELVGTTAPPEAPVPATFPGTGSFGRIAGRREEDAPRASGISGRILKYNGQSGEWLLGEGKEVVAAGTTVWVVGMTEAWVLWQGGKLVKYAPERPDGSLPWRSELQPPHDDRSAWAISAFTGEVEDPWQLRICALAAIMSGEHQGTEVTLIASSPSAKQALRELAGRIAYYQQRVPGTTATVRLGGYRKPGARAYFKPTLEVTSWLDAKGMPIVEADTTPVEADTTIVENDTTSVETAAPAGAARARRVTISEEIDDENPF